MNVVLGQAVLVLLLCQATAAGDGPLFELSFDEGLTARRATGKAKPVAAHDAHLSEGRDGQAFQARGGAQLGYSADGSIDKKQGTVCMWVMPYWSGDDGKNHIFFCDDRQFKTGENAIRFWKWSVGTLRLDVRDQGDHYLTFDVKCWKAKEWHHIAASWDAASGTRLFIDGELVAQKHFSFEPKQSTRIFIGSEDGKNPADALIDDVRIYPFPLDRYQLARVMRGQPLQRVEYVGLAIPDEIVAGKPFPCTLTFQSKDILTGEYEMLVLLDSLPVCQAKVRIQRKNEVMSCTIEATIPDWLYPDPGIYTLSALLAGTIPKGQEHASEEVKMVSQPIAHSRTFTVADDGSIARDGASFLAERDDFGLLVDGVFLPADDAGMAKARELVESGKIVDALRCRLLDEVDCATALPSWENAPSEVADLVPNSKFRVVGSQENVTQTVTRHGRERQAMPAFSYQLRVSPGPTPHILTVESVNDVERYLEVAVDTAEGSKPTGPFTAMGIGARQLIHLGVTYTGREYPTDNKPFVSTFMFFPKTEAISITITGNPNARRPDAQPAAVSEIKVYELVDSLRDMADPIRPPRGHPERTIGLFYPHVGLMFDRYGFPDAGPRSRACTVKLFLDYSRFLGFNLFAYRAFSLSPKTVFRCEEFEQAADLDMFDEFQHRAEEENITVIPRIMYMHCYHKLLAGDDDNFQQDINGEIVAFGREGPLPDPLRPNVQELVKKSFRAILKRAKPFKNIPAVGFDTSIGGLYWTHPRRDMTNAESGYSKWDVAEFSRETGIGPDLVEMTHKERYEWLRENAWEQWISWRCKRWHTFICQLRDICVDAGKYLVLCVRIMPRVEWAEKGVPLKEICRYTGYDPDLFRNEKKIVQSWFIRVNADRYFGSPYWKPWFYDPAQLSLYGPTEACSFELYFNYWELPAHPLGFRVGPASPVGRAFFEPFTYAMRTTNPYSITLFHWFRATLGHEMDLREFARAFRALPAATPRPFDGEIRAEPNADRLAVKWFSDRLGIINDSPVAKTVEITMPAGLQISGNLFDVAMNSPVKTRNENGRRKLSLQLRAYDFRTLLTPLR